MAVVQIRYKYSIMSNTNWWFVCLFKYFRLYMDTITATRWNWNQMLIQWCLNYYHSTDPLNIFHNFVYVAIIWRTKAHNILVMRKLRFFSCIWIKSIHSFSCLKRYGRCKKHRLHSSINSAKCITTLRYI